MAGLKKRAKGRVTKMFSVACGNWNNSANAGVFNRNFNNNRSNSNNNYGFRASDYIFKPQISGEKSGEIGVTFPVGKTTKSAKSVTTKNSHSYNYFLNINNLYDAYLSARKHKRSKKAIFEFEKNLGLNLYSLKKELEDLTYKPSAYRTFYVYEPKQRLIVAPNFRDSVIQHMIYNYIYDVFDRSFIYDNYGCRKLKGTHKASARLQNFMRKHSNDKYYLQLDIRKYYYNINHNILRNFISKIISDERIVNLIMLFVDTVKGIGLFVGNVLSQLFGLIYLSPLDHFVKRVLKIKHYIRYVDDFVLVGLEKSEAHILKSKIESFLKDNLNLELSKFRIAKIKQGCNFVGFRTWKRVKFIRKHTLHNFSKAVKLQKEASIISILGHAKHSSSHKYLISKLGAA